MNVINHIAFVIDSSSSMQPISDAVVRVADAQIATMARLSQSLEQDTRATIYSFADRTKCIQFDRDVLRLGSIKSHYKPYGNTALISATIKAIDDLMDTSTLYGEHAFLLYIITDGEETVHDVSPEVLTRRIKSLPSNWTIAALVPNGSAKFIAMKYGFDASNIEIWDQTERGVEEIGRKLEASTSAYMTARSQGVITTRGLFAPSTDTLNTASVQNNLYEVAAQVFYVPTVQDKIEIKDFVERATGKPYQKGRAYYQLTKTEEIQASKIIAIRDKVTNSVYSGQAARQMLGLPDYTLKVAPSKHPKYEIFVQSLSTNRKLVGGTNVVII